MEISFIAIYKLFSSLIPSYQKIKSQVIIFHFSVFATDFPMTEYFPYLGKGSLVSKVTQLQPRPRHRHPQKHIQASNLSLHLLCDQKGSCNTQSLFAYLQSKLSSYTGHLSLSKGLEASPSHTWKAAASLVHHQNTKRQVFMWCTIGLSSGPAFSQMKNEKGIQKTQLQGQLI